MPSRIFAILLFSAFALGQQQLTTSVANREMVKEDSGVQVWRLRIAPHTSSQAFVHSRNYVFVPLTDLEVMHSIRPGTDHNPLAPSAKAGVRTSWVLSDSHIQFVHPEGTEPSGGQVIYNQNEVPYAALEIMVDDGLPILEIQVSLFGAGEDSNRSWRIGKFLLNIQRLKPGDQVKDLSGEKTLFSISAMTLGIGQEHNRLTVQPGQPVELAASGHYCNMTTVDTSVLLLSRLSPEELLPVLSATEGHHE